ncbi:MULTISPECIES: ComZ family protein [Shouchella]|uniref:Competence protein ComG n=1 Tax=Shouchella clausii TaxID=79880 RepID=A0A268P1B5_SHOCL|nr:MULTISPECIES: ComZ family protein [Shouchella]MCM3380336.1 ComZ family protein [Shouchella rhizosphaerae]MDO7267545.1 ComZ family protein [Shouchella clausii]MDO7287501.1 ComZ family protein [Shouchella clausii]PAE82472.1 competence protein ComG [Shouchella clausii]PAE89533.1 competence protein ComG [Shouchella clausii]
MEQHERNLKFMEIAMKHVPEARKLLEGKGIDVTMDELQPLLSLLLHVMNEAYELGLNEQE